MMASQEEASLIQKARRGDAVAQCALMARYRTYLIKVLRSMNIDHEDAEEILSDCFRKLFNANTRFEYTGKLTGWLSKVAGNLAIDRQRREKRTVPYEDVLYEAKKSSHEESCLNQVVLREALEQLDSKESRVIYLRYYTDMTREEVGEQMGLGGSYRDKSNHVYQIERAALKRLKKHLSNAL